VRASRFAAMLDEAIGRAAPEPVMPAAAPWRRWPGPEPVSPFLRMPPLTTGAPCWPLATGAPARRPAHRLTAEQQHAFERFERLGARVPAGFTAEELRRAYRQLALRFHPDRHADHAALEREQRARNFAEAADLYRCLRAVVEPRH
jgi:hypothetical protein